MTDNEALDIISEGFWSGDGLSIATDGYWLIELIIEDIDGTKKKVTIPYQMSDKVTVDDIYLRVLIVLKAFLICH